MRSKRKCGGEEMRNKEWWWYHDKVLDAILNSNGPPDEIIKNLEIEEDGVKYNISEWVRHQKYQLESLPYDQQEALKKLVEVGLWSGSDRDVINISQHYKYDIRPISTGKARARDYIWTSPFQDDNYRYQFADTSIDRQKVLITTNFNPNQPKTLPCSKRETLVANRGVNPTMLDPALIEQTLLQATNVTIVPEKREAIAGPAIEIKANKAKQPQKKGSSSKTRPPVRHIQEHKLATEDREEVVQCCVFVYANDSADDNGNLHLGVGQITYRQDRTMTINRCMIPVHSAQESFAAYTSLVLPTPVEISPQFICTESITFRKGEDDLYYLVNEIAQLMRSLQESVNLIPHTLTINHSL